jgi:DNA (cytosine-5)-methyltransferase 1
MRRVVADVTPRLVYAENVSAKAINAAADDLESLGYKTRAIPFSAADLGADHERQRYWLLAYTDDARELLREQHAKMAKLPIMARGVWGGDAGGARVPYGLANRMDRIKATGNGQVAIVAATAFAILAGK